MHCQLIPYKRTLSSNGARRDVLLTGGRINPCQDSDAD